MSRKRARTSKKGKYVNPQGLYDGGPGGRLTTLFNGAQSGVLETGTTVYKQFGSDGWFSGEISAVRYPEADDEDQRCFVYTVFSSTYLCLHLIYLCLASGILYCGKIMIDRIIIVPSSRPHRRSLGHVMILMKTATTARRTGPNLLVIPPHLLPCVIYVTLIHIVYVCR